MTKPQAMKGGSHALKKRCARCKKVRKFYRWTDGHSSFAPRWRDAAWTKIDGQWVCRFCVPTGKELPRSRKVMPKSPQNPSG